MKIVSKLRILALVLISMSVLSIVSCSKDEGIGKEDEDMGIDGYDPSRGDIYPDDDADDL